MRQEYITILSFFSLHIRSAFAQVDTRSQCNQAFVGGCLGDNCPTGFTCVLVPSRGCCLNANLGPITTTGATTVSTVATTAATGTCVDLINPLTGTSDCPLKAYLCNNAVYFLLMTQQCPRTCNRCSGVTNPGAGACVDLLNPATGISDCPSRVYLCQNSIYFALMTQQCPLTCNRCTSTGITNPGTGTCIDLLNPSTGVSDCPSRAYLCNNAVYFTLMTQQCPRTCGRCTGTGGVTTGTLVGLTGCVDLVNPSTGVSDCPARAYLCSNSIYFTLMTQQCPATCGRC